MMDKFNIAEYERDVAYDTDETLGEADVWHEGTKSFYRAKLLKRLTPEEALFDPTDDTLPPTEGLNPPGPRWL